MSEAGSRGRGEERGWHWSSLHPASLGRSGPSPSNVGQLHGRPRRRPSSRSSWWCRCAGRGPGATGLDLRH
eukprot:7094544-Pyramimonas_sp.AAC.1